MEHYKSTLGVTAAAISALVLASQIMQAGPFAPSPPRIERVMASLETSAEETAWVNPPARQQAEAMPQVAQVEAEAKPAEVPVSPVAQAIAPVATQSLARQVPRKAASVQRRKAAQRPVRTRHAALETSAPADAAGPQAVPTQPPADTKRIDPIGDIIRGLGFGGQG